jgi:hypothetical protein
MKRLATALSVGAALLVGGYVPSAVADPTTPSPTPATTSAPSAPAAAAGQFCGKDLEGKTGTASDGSVLTCTAGSDGRDRWTASTGAPSATPAAGQFCSKDLEGKTGTASDGSTLTCTAGSDGRDRWTAK